MYVKLAQFLKGSDFSGAVGSFVKDTLEIWKLPLFAMLSDSMDQDLLAPLGLKPTLRASNKAFKNCHQGATFHISIYGNWRSGNFMLGLRERMNMYTGGLSWNWPMVNRGWLCPAFGVYVFGALACHMLPYLDKEESLVIFSADRICAWFVSLWLGGVGSVLGGWYFIITPLQLVLFPSKGSYNWFVGSGEQARKEYPHINVPSIWRFIDHY